MSRSTTNQRIRKAVLAENNVRVALYMRRSTDEDNQPYSIEMQDEKT